MFFKGWVPTATGHLSFTAFGDTEYPTKCMRQGRPDCFCIVQNRSLLDTILPLPFSGWTATRLRELFARYVLGISGDFKFVMLGEHNEASQAIEGFIFLVPLIRNKAQLEILEVKVANLAARGEIKPIDYQNFIDHLRDISWKAARFKLQRDGECLIVTSGESADSQRRKLEHILANQFFFFVKDSFHKHQHHHPTHDAIITSFPVHSPDDDSWIEKTQHRLYRQIIRFKRYKDQKTLYRASGVLAYAQAFEQNFSKRKTLKVFRTDELEKSLSVRRDEIRHQDQLRLNRHQITVTWFFTISAFMISIAFLARLDEGAAFRVSPIIPFTTQLIANFPLAALGVAYFLARTLRMRALSEFPSEWQIIRNIYQLLRGGPLERFILITICIGLGLMYIALRLVLLALA